MKLVLFLFMTTLVNVNLCIPIQGDGSTIGDIELVNKACKARGELQDTFDEDVKYTEEQLAAQGNEGLGDHQHHRSKRGLGSRVTLWSDNTLHYTVSNAFSSAQKQIIEDALDELRSKTCIKFMRHNVGSAPTSHVEIVNESGCWSYIGRQRSKQKLSLQSSGCVHEHIIQHEIMHALGIYHEQSRPDRDDYVIVNWQNIQSGFAHNFNKQKDIESMGVPYDLQSVMHYGSTAFSSNRQKTIVAKTNPNQRLGGRILTQFDIEQLNLFYGCQNPTSTTTTTTTTTTTKRPTSSSTTTTTKKPTSSSTTTTTKKPTSSSTTTTTKRPTTGPGEVCGDTSFDCVYAYYNQNYCYMDKYKVMCPQTCKQCKTSKRIKCGNFTDNEDFYCKSKKRRCVASEYGTRYEMKKNCPKTCCEMGRLYF